MNPTLNSPKYADPKSLAFQMYKKQQDRKQRINPYVPQLEQRYFRRNEGSTDYATIPTVTLAGDFVIEGSFLTSNSGSAGTFVGGTTISTAEVLLDILTDGKVRFVVYSSSGSFAGLIQSAVGFNDGRLHTFKATMNGKSAELFVDGVSVGTGNYSSYDFVNTSRLCVRSNNTNPFNGILANLKIYDNGTLVRDYPINDNSSTIRDLANGQDGTIINGNASDWGLFDRQANGDWLGQELVVNGGFDSADLSQWSTSAETEMIIVNNQLKVTTVYLANNAKPTIWVHDGSYLFSFDAVNGVDDRFRYSVYNYTASKEYIPPTFAELGHVSVSVKIEESGNVGFLPIRDSLGIGDYILDNVSVKEVLKNA